MNYDAVSHTGSHLSADLSADFSGIGSVDHDDSVSVASYRSRSVSVASQTTGQLSELDKARKEHFDLLGASRLRKYAHAFSNTGAFSTFILVIIFINTILIALQTTASLTRAAGWYFNLIDGVFLGIYIFEMVIKLYASRLHYFNSAWNRFDCLIVFASILDLVLPLAVSVSAFDPKIFRLLRIFRAVRAIRALRVLRTIKFLKSLQVIVTTLFKSIPALGNISMLIGLVLWRWGDMGRACFTLFQLMTMDDWFFMYSDVADEDSSRAHIFAFLSLFIVIETLIFINLFVAVIVDNLQQSQERQNAHKKRRPRIGRSSMNIPGDLEFNLLVKRAEEFVPGNYDNTLMDLNSYYPDKRITKRDKELFAHYLRLLAAMDYTAEQLEERQALLDSLTDMANPRSEKDAADDGGR